MRSIIIAFQRINPDLFWYFPGVQQVMLQAQQAMLRVQQAILQVHEVMLRMQQTMLQVQQAIFSELTIELISVQKS